VTYRGRGAPPENRKKTNVSSCAPVCSRVVGRAVRPQYHRRPRPKQREIPRPSPSRSLSPRPPPTRARPESVRERAAPERLSACVRVQVQPVADRDYYLEADRTHLEFLKAGEKWIKDEGVAVMDPEDGFGPLSAWQPRRAEVRGWVDPERKYGVFFGLIFSSDRGSDGRRECLSSVCRFVASVEIHWPRSAVET
jgi:hypothetical protein